MHLAYGLVMVTIGLWLCRRDYVLATPRGRHADFSHELCGRRIARDFRYVYLLTVAATLLAAYFCLNAAWRGRHRRRPLAPRIGDRPRCPDRHDLAFAYTVAAGIGERSRATVRERKGRSAMPVDIQTDLLESARAVPAAVTPWAPDTARIAVVIPSYRVAATVLDVVRRIGPECALVYVVDDACPERSGDVVANGCEIRASA
jgi:hypothetical protein